VSDAERPKGSTASLRFRASQRVKRNADFRAAREQGRRIDCGAFMLTWRVRSEPALGPARVGVVASRAAVGGAVERNRAKRRLRELFRQHQALVPAGLDLVLTARAAVLRLPLAELEQRFAYACRKLPGSEPSTNV
jgi:ribonuclease P protein component